MSSINYSEKIPNNVNLSEDRTLQRALEQMRQSLGAYYEPFALIRDLQAQNPVQARLPFEPNIH